MIKPIRCLALVAVVQGFIISQSADAHEFVVKLKAPPQSIEKFIRETQSEKISAISKKENLYLVSRNMVERQEYGMAALRAVSNVEAVEANTFYKLNSVPNDPLYAIQWGLKNLDRIDLDIEAEKAWDITTGSDKVTVAIIDTGITLTQEDLKENIWTNEAEANGQPDVDDDGNGYVDDVHGYNFNDEDANIDDTTGHGTMTAGVVGAKGNNGVGVAGVAWNVKIMPLKYSYSDYGGTLANVLRAFEYAMDKNVDIILTPFSSTESSPLLLEAIERAQQKNILIVASAGNEADDNDVTPKYPASYEVENVLSVAALDSKGALTNYSNYGRHSVDVGAPGVNIATTDIDGYNSNWEGSTSAAAAYVAGIAALLKSNDSNLMYFDLKDRIVYSARQVASLSGKIASGGMATAYYSLINQVAPVDTSDPAGWTMLEQTVETPHPYNDNETTTYTVTVPNAKKFAVLFEQFELENDYDFVTMKDSTGREIGKWTGDHSGEFSPTVQGDTLTLEFTSDGSANKYGFLINKVYYAE